MRWAILQSIIIISLSITLNDARAQNAAIDSLLQIIQTSEKDTNYAKALNAVAFEYISTNPLQAREYAQRAIQIAEKLSFKKNIARSYNVIGSSYWAEGKYEKSLDFYLTSLKMYEEVDDKKGIAICFNNIGEIFKRQGDLEKALENHLKSLNIKETYLSHLKPIVSYTNIAELYFELEDIEKALEFNNKALKAATETSNQKGMAYAYSGLGKIYIKKGDYKKATEYFNLGLEIMISTGDKRGIITSYHEIGSLYSKLMLYTLAKNNFDKAIVLSKEIGAKDLEMDSYFFLSQNDSAQFNFKRSLANYKKYTSLKDSLFNIEKSEQIIKMETQYGTAAKEKENTLLRKEKEAKDTKIKLQAIVIIAIGIILFLVFVILMVLIIQKRKQKKVNSTLTLKNQEIKNQKDEIDAQAQELKSLIESLNDLNKSLELKVRKRTSLLEQKNKKLAQYAFINAHKLRSPAASILGLINLFEKPQSSGDINDEIISHLKLSAKKLDRVIQDITNALNDEDFRYDKK